MGDCGWEPRDLAVTLGSSQESRTTGDAATRGEPGVRLKPEKNKPSGPYVFFPPSLSPSLHAHHPVVCGWVLGRGMVGRQAPMLVDISTIAHVCRLLYHWPLERMCDAITPSS